MGACVITDYKDSMDTEDWRVLCSISAMFAWLKIIYFGRLFVISAGLIRMIIEIMQDMKRFVLVFLLSIAGFMNAFDLIARNQDKDNEILGGKLSDSLIYTWAGGLGDFSFDGFNYDYEVMIYILWVIFTVMTTLILLNLLIAIMGDTFDRVQETYAANTSKELCTLMVENEIFVRRGFLFKNQKYIIVIQEERAEEGEESWEGKMKSIRKFMESTVGV